MTEADRNAQFQKISGKVEAATEKTTAAWQKTRDELASEVANAKDKACEAAGHLENRAQTARARRVPAQRQRHSFVVGG
jgi:predicted Holliday junction resolvase-like endonuclease